MTDRNEPVIITVDIGHMASQEWRPQYIVVIDPASAEQLIAIARAHPRVFVFSFIEHPYDDGEVPNFLPLGESDVANYVAPPYVIWNVPEHQREIAKTEVLRTFLSPCFEQAERIEP